MIKPIRCIQKIDYNGVEFGKCNGVIVPVYIPENIQKSDKNNIEIITFRAEGGKRKGMLEFLGGIRDEGENAMDTAIREAFEESCGYLKITKKDLEYCPFQKIMNTFVWYVRVPKMTNITFQEFLGQETRSHFLEMDRLVRVPLSEFIRIGYSKNEDPKVISVYGKEYTLWRIASLHATFLYKKRKTDSFLKILLEKE